MKEEAVVVEKVADILADSSLEFRSKKTALARAAENSIHSLYSDATVLDYLSDGTICDLAEGNAPYRPRYILPDYRVFMENGSAFLGFKPPADLYEATGALMAVWSWVPSITGYPVYLGDLDDLLEPFMETVTARERERLVSLMLAHVERTMPDAFVHADLGPSETETGRLILQAERALKNAVPNITLRVGKNTPQSFLELAVATALETGKPYFVNHEAVMGDLGPDYAVASCYNTLLRGGGSHTLARLSLKNTALRAGSKEIFLKSELPRAIGALVTLINERANHIVEKAKFFDSSFLVREGALSLSRFTSMAGIFGLYECVEILSGGKSMGTDPDADELAERIITEARKLVKSTEGAYCGGTGGKIVFHAQSGIDTDRDVTPGTRVRSGNEAPLAAQLAGQGKLHCLFDAGASEICVFDRTAKSNPAGLVTVIKGAHQAGIRVLAVSSSDSDLVRVTGYLVKRSDAERWLEGERSFREDTVGLAAETIRAGGVLSRTARTLA